MSGILHFRWFGRVHCLLQIAVLAAMVLCAIVVLSGWLSFTIAFSILVAGIALFVAIGGPVWTRFRKGWIADQVGRGMSPAEAEARFSALYED